MKRYAVLPGSFDPPTLGHLDLARRAARLFGACRVVVMNNRLKTYRFSLEERFALCRAAFEGEEGITVDCYEGMLYEYLSDRRDEAVLVKGVRNEKDFLYEREMAAYNFAHCGVKTLYLDAKAEYSELSSTLVRRKMEENEDLNSFLSEKVIKHLQNKL
ncbi:MAG: pantetheine-phosphate adenylyltransferase [Clostridia bacterium]|nr:pantetheine-phosphate adenylyltransferase [Clostridia bacterium]